MVHVSLLKLESEININSNLSKTENINREVQIGTKFKVMLIIETKIFLKMHLVHKIEDFSLKAKLKHARL